jgi:CRISPR/Cas system CMR-associated protein Cmr1 (group 7 of RAMP superfamily)
LSVISESSITTAYDALTNARRELWGATERATRARMDLEKERGARILTGEIVGKNEAERDARARELLTSLFEAVEAAEVDERSARMTFDLARIEVERIDAVLRLIQSGK